MCSVAVQSGNAAALTVATVLSAALGGAACCWVAARFRTGLNRLESVLADPEAAAERPTGLFEFDRSAGKIAQDAAHWETVAANTRRQTHEMQSMMQLLNRRGASDEPMSSQLRGLLSGLGQTLHSHVEQIEQGTGEVEQAAQAIVEGADAQGHAVVKATTYVEQLAGSIDSVSQQATAAQAVMGRTEESATRALEHIQTLISGLHRVHSDSQTCEKKLSGLCDPSQQITAILGTITEIAARTDMLALNASIEAIRAGEHGRGFAIVADEVRKLAEQATDATQEISSLVDTMQLVTQESIHGIAREREQLESEVARAQAAADALRQIPTAVDEDAQPLRQIVETSTQQLSLMSEVVGAIEQISKIAKANRGSGENVCWTMKTLSKPSPQLNAAMDRLRQCGGAATIEANQQAQRAEDTRPVRTTRGLPTTPMMPVALVENAAATAAVE